MTPNEQAHASLTRLMTDPRVLQVKIGPLEEDGSCPIEVRFQYPHKPEQELLTAAENTLDDLARRFDEILEHELIEWQPVGYAKRLREFLENLAVEGVWSEYDGLWECPACGERRNKHASECVLTHLDDILITDHIEKEATDG
jgi:hypothetical protein